MTVLHSGGSNDYSDNFAAAFGKAQPAKKKKSAKKKSSDKKSKAAPKKKK